MNSSRTCATLRRLGVSAFMAAFAIATPEAVVAQGASACGPLRIAMSKTLGAPRIKETMGLAAGDDKPAVVQLIRIDRWEYFEDHGSWEKEQLKDPKEGQLGMVLSLAIALADHCQSLGARKVDSFDATGYAFSALAKVAAHAGEAWVDNKSGRVISAKSSIKDPKMVVNYTYRYEYGPKVQPPKVAKDVTLERQRVLNKNAPADQPASSAATKESKKPAAAK